MASSSRQFYTLVLLLTNCHSGLGCKDEPVTDDIAGSTVRMEVLPKSINELITDEITIMCTPKDLPRGNKGVLFMELGKEGEHPLVAVKGSTLELGTGIKTNMQARGNIAENASDSFLQLTIQRPFVDDVNVYCCRVFYQDAFGELKMGHVYADVSVENDDKAVLVHLLQKQSDLESDLSKQREYTHELETDLLKQQNFTHKLETDLLKQQNYTHELERTIKEKDMKVLTRMDVLEEAGMNRSVMLQNFQARDSFSSAFSASGTKSSLNRGETLMFQRVELNVGGHYDRGTGVYTAPKKGLYVFHLFLWGGRNDGVWIKLKKNWNVVAGLYAGDNGYSDQSSIDKVLTLDVGDKVLPYVYESGPLAHANEKQTVFNGYLLQLL